MALGGITPKQKLALVAKALLLSCTKNGGLTVVSSGNVTDEIWKENIINQRLPEPDDDFDVV